MKALYRVWLVFTQWSTQETPDGWSRLEKFTNGMSSAATERLYLPRDFASFDS
jgi:hypothetical protein